MFGVLFTLLLQQAQKPAEIRTLSVAVTSAKGVPVTSLAVEELAVVENGVTREITRVERDARPLDVAILVDTSAAAGSSYRLVLVDSVLHLIDKLPAGSRFTLWATGDRPTKLVDVGSDRVAAQKALQRMSPAGGSTVLDAIVEAAKDLKKNEGERRAMVVVSAAGVEFSGRDRYQVVDAVAKDLDIFSAVLFEEGTSEAPEVLLSYEFVFGELAKRTGGLFERPLTAMAVEGVMQAIGVDLQSHMRISYATLPEIKDRKVEIKVARPGVKVRVGTGKS
jgi:hypothetical protein